MIGRTRERATLLLLRFVPAGQNRIAQHDPRVSCLFVESQIDGYGHKESQTIPPRQIKIRSVLKMLLKTNPLKIEKPTMNP
ncbi:hypothetical protein PY092_17880 [Muricauda sp. 334s03]|uniref:Uncharacterized protein n=1 Tax=Flagellimonas yonaguniensis TaxID=3031325 RepID=A0ABT5Y3L0_9FLAO|nr:MULTISPECIES: hypothetical protein [Allomuricauda]MBA4744555.1 hypothetical protein [Allomuricauda sp.]MDF0718038.1 hypothetical protein [[Muricauda] yonaguniensis]